MKTIMRTLKDLQKEDNLYLTILVLFEFKKTLTERFLIAVEKW